LFLIGSATAVKISWYNIVLAPLFFPMILGRLAALAGEKS